VATGAHRLESIFSSRRSRITLSIRADLDRFPAELFFSSGRPIRTRKRLKSADLNRTNIRNVFRFRFESVYRFGPAGSRRFVDSSRPTLIALSIRLARRESLCRFAAPAANRSVDSRRPTRIALSIRGARRESLCRFAAPDANRSVDSRRPTPDANRSVDSRRPPRIALSIRVARRESLCRFAAPAARRESLCRFAAPHANRSVDSRRPTRIALSIRVARPESLCWPVFLATSCARLSADLSFCRLAVIDFRLPRHVGDSLCKTSEIWLVGFCGCAV
jgi:hypothetical protein